MSEREELIAMATQLEDLADDGGAEFESILATFNGRLKSTCDRRQFEVLHASMSLEELVDDLLETREAEPFVDPVDEAGLLALVERAHRVGARSIDQQRAGDALAKRSRLPEDLAHDLASGCGQFVPWPEPADIVRFALQYVPPSSRDELLALVRDWLADMDGGHATTLAAVGERLFRERQATLQIADLARQTARFASGVPEQRVAAMRFLRKLCTPAGNS